MKTNLDRSRALSFDSVASDYDVARPRYRTALYRRIAEAAGWQPGAHVLEIGAGSGQATLELLQFHISVCALEPAASLAELARTCLRDHPWATVVTVTFEDWTCEDNTFDSVVSANAFHWIDPNISFDKCASILKNNGVLAIWWSVPYFRSRVVRDLQYRIAKRYGLGPVGQVPLPEAVQSLYTGREDIENNDLWQIDPDETYTWTVTLSPDQFASLLLSYADAAALERAQRQRYRETLLYELSEAQIRAVHIEHGAVQRIARRSM